MTDSIPCFWMTETDRVEQWLRRYTHSAKESPTACPINGHYHQARVRIEDAPLVLNKRGMIESGDWPHDDARWPTTCACGYAFKESDQWQLFIEHIFKTAEGALYTIRNAPPGAMWDAHWMRNGGPGDWVGPDGISLMVKLPNGREWLVDGPSHNGDGWKRTGVIPNVTAMPSILAADYHGWLRDGQLVPA